MNATPLLDRLQSVEVNAPRRRGRLVWGALAGIAIGIAATQSGWVEAHVPVVLWLFPALLAAIFVHELGHLASSRAAGFRFRQFAAGPFLVVREAGGLRLRFAPERLFAGGQVVAVPDSTTELRRRFLVFIAGGPLASVALMAAIALLPPGSFRSALWVMGFVVAAVSLRPAYSGGNLSDGQCLVVMRRAGPDADMLTGILYIMAMDTQGVPPSDWDASVVESLGRPAAAPLAAHARFLLVSRAWHASDPEELTEACERALALAPHMAPTVRRDCFDSAGWAQAFCRGDAERAEAWLADARAVSGAISPPDWDAATLGAIALARGERAAARTHWTRAIARLECHPGSSGSILASRKRLERLSLSCEPLER